MPDVFISYSHNDQAVVDQLRDALADEGLSVFSDKSIRPGQRCDEAIEEALSKVSAVIVLWSQSSIQSDWVREEAAYAREQGKLLPVISMPASSVPIGFSQLASIRLPGSGAEIDDKTRTAIIKAVREMAQRTSQK